MLNFVFIHRTVIGYNFLQQQAKLWNKKTTTGPTGAASKDESPPQVT